MVLQMKSLPNDELTIEFRCKSTNPKFYFELNDIEIIPTAQIANVVTLTLDINHGFHMLKMSVVDITDVDIVDLYLNDVSFGATRFLIFGTNKAGKVQTTSINHHVKELYIPFINPLSFWFAEVEEKIPNRFFAGGLYQSMEVYYPQSITLPEKFSKTIKDYFKYNQSFYVVDKNETVHPYYNKKIPYCLAPKINYNESELFAEFMDNLNLLSSQRMEHQAGSYLVNVVVVQPDQPKFDPATRFLLDKSLFPNLYKLLESLNIGEILQAFVGLLPPGGEIGVHMDSVYVVEYLKVKYETDKYTGCSQLYIPINFKPGNYFKFTNVGILPLDNGPLVINNRNFSHGLVNNSDEWRFAIGIVGTELK